MPRIYLLVVLMILSSKPTIAQIITKKAPKANDFQLWHNLDIQSVSDQGDWISYIKSFRSKPDTIFVSNIITNKTYSVVDTEMVGVNFGEFGDGFFTFIKKDASVGILDLNSGKTSLLRNCIRYYIASNKKNILAIGGKGKLKRILRVDKYGVVLDSITNVTAEVLSSSGNHLAFVQQNTLGFVLKNYEFSSGKIQLLHESKQEIQNIVFGEEDRHVAFFSGTLTEPNTVNFIERSSGSYKYYTLKEKDSVKIYLNKKLKISRDGSKVFFDTYSISAIKQLDQKVEVWHSMDEIIYPKRIAGSKKYNFSVWYPHKGIFQKYGEANETAQLSGQENYVIFYRDGLDGQDGKRYHLNSIFIESLQTGKRLLVVNDITMEKSRVSLSPTADRMAYYYKDEWWSYDMKSGKHNSLTKSIKGQWDDRTELRTQTDIYATALWTKDGQSVLLQDKNDLWLVSLDGLLAKRITNGKEQDIEFRLDSYNLRDKIRQPYVSLQYRSISMDNSISLTASGNSKEKGYFVLHKGRMPQALFYGDFDASQLHQAKQGRYFTKVQSFDLPPTIHWTDGADKPIKIAIRSNPQHSEYSWGKSELITYRASDGKFLKAALLYPAGYDPAKKYPMVVKIYQNMSHHLHEYILPSSSDEQGFNVVNYTLDDYLVLLPDIGYNYGKPGISAAESVEAVVNKVKEMGIVDSRCIGIIGHSFGGYEVNFIMTRSSTFAAAVSGAGVSDMTGAYFSIDNSYKGTQAWRYESQQYRMGKSFYDTKESYYENSPIFHAEKISTPMLIWTGKDDPTVSPSQSVALYHVMRRLDKVGVLLQYKGEDHNLIKSENQRDLSERVKCWFDHYLKGKQAAEWMSPNIN